jgi:hypothetical protein
LEAFGNVSGRLLGPFGQLSRYLSLDVAEVVELLAPSGGRALELIGQILPFL